jgi:Tol biopolymer transport system component
MNADGSGQRYLGEGFSPDWSPDGTKIVFTTGEPDGGIHVMQANGTGRTLLISHEFASAGGGDYGVMTPAWSPDGKTIAFVRASDDGWGIYLINTDGSSPRRLYACCGQAEPSWSLDGSRIAHQALGISIVNSDGTNLTRLIGGNAFYPDWSAEGVVVSMGTGWGPTVLGGMETRIFLVTASNAYRQIIPNVDAPMKYGDSDPAWAP